MESDEFLETKNATVVCVLQSAAEFGVFEFVNLKLFRPLVKQYFCLTFWIKSNVYSSLSYLITNLMFIFS